MAINSRLFCKRERERERKMWLPRIDEGEEIRGQGSRRERGREREGCGHPLPLQLVNGVRLVERVGVWIDDVPNLAS